MFRLAIVQHEVKGCNKSENANLAVKYIAEAKKNGADMVLFPECWLTSYYIPEICGKAVPTEEIEKDMEFIKWNKSALGDDDSSLGTVRNAAEKYHVGVCITAFTKGISRPRNSAYIIGRQGEILLKYSKVHTCDFSLESCLESGDEFKVCSFDGLKVGVMICYDREYPESARELALQGAEMILVPNCCSDMKMRLRELSVRSMENMCAVAMANPPGENMGCSCAYHPMVWDYEDNLITAADRSFDGIIYADFDMDKIRVYRQREDIGKYRKPSAYKTIISN